jgi:phosphatidylinositol alpha-1,6-mannosyltransferase
MIVTEPTSAPARQAGPPGPALLLTPSRGLGGGIERYVATVQSAFAEHGVEHRRLDLSRPGPAGHAAMLAEAGTALAALRPGGQFRLVLAHRALLPVAAVLARRPEVSGISVICHGSDVWGRRADPRWLAERWLMRRPGVRVVAVSSFTAGALFPAARGDGTRATVLPPGLSRSWFGALAAAATGPGPRPRPGLELTTAFRLDDWRDKGLPELTAALGRLSRTDVRLTVCGSGTPPADLVAHVGRYRWCRLRPALTDGELADQLADSDLLVLATRTRAGGRPSGEGFGLVLLEAQVAGTAVIGPAHGGSPGAYLDGVTGATPRDESVAALAEVLDGLLRDPAELAAMGVRGAVWARASFAPDRYAALAVNRLL